MEVAEQVTTGKIWVLIAIPSPMFAASAIGLVPSFQAKLVSTEQPQVI